MKRLLTLAALVTLMSGPALAANTQDMPAEIKKNQEAQIKLMAAMVTEKKSRLGFNETVAALQNAARKRGWELGKIVDVQAELLKTGVKGAKPFKMLPMCRKDLAEKLLKEQAAQKVMPFAPCRMSVFEGDDGKTYIARPNTELMAQMATPAYAPLLKQFAEEEKALLANITE